MTVVSVTLHFDAGSKLSIHTCSCHGLTCDGIHIHDMNSVLRIKYVMCIVGHLYNVVTVWILKYHLVVCP